jgi:hypothetical protein
MGNLRRRVSEYTKSNGFLQATMRMPDEQRNRLLDPAEAFFRAAFFD